MTKILGQWWDFLLMKTFRVAERMGSSNAIWLSIDAQRKRLKNILIHLGFKSYHLGLGKTKQSRLWAVIDLNKIIIIKIECWYYFKYIAPLFGHKTTKIQNAIISISTFQHFQRWLKKWKKFNIMSFPFYSSPPLFLLLTWIPYVQWYTSYCDV
jgi:hypothetical protein